MTKQGSPTTRRSVLTMGATAAADAAGLSARAASDGDGSRPRSTRSRTFREDCRRHAGRYEYLVELDGHEDDLPTPLRSSLLRSPLLAG
jgi:hypothetical protein